MLKKHTGPMVTDYVPLHMKNGSKDKKVENDQVDLEPSKDLDKNVSKSQCTSDVQPLMLVFLEEGQSKDDLDPNVFEEAEKVVPSCLEFLQNKEMLKKFQSLMKHSKRQNEPMSQTKNSEQSESDLGSNVDSKSNPQEMKKEKDQGTVVEGETTWQDYDYTLLLLGKAMSVIDDDATFENRKCILNRYTLVGNGLISILTKLISKTHPTHYPPKPRLPLLKKRQSPRLQLAWKE